MVNSREDFHLQDLAHAGRTKRPLAVATLSIPALKGEVFREFSIKSLANLTHTKIFHNCLYQPDTQVSKNKCLSVKKTITGCFKSKKVSLLEILCIFQS